MGCEGQGVCTFQNPCGNQLKKIHLVSIEIYWEIFHFILKKIYLYEMFENNYIGVLILRRNPFFKYSIYLKNLDCLNLCPMMYLSWAMMYVMGGS